MVGPHGRLYIAEVDGRPVGVGALKRVSDEVGEVKRMFVRPEGRGRGVARALLEQLLDDADALGYRRVRLETLVFMTEAHRLYRSLGFEDIDIFDGNEGSLSGLEGLMLFMERTIV